MYILGAIMYILGANMYILGAIIYILGANMYHKGTNMHLLGIFEEVFFFFLVFLKRYSSSGSFCTFFFLRVLCPLCEHDGYCGSVSIMSVDLLISLAQKNRFNNSKTVKCKLRKDVKLHCYVPVGPHLTLLSNVFLLLNFDNQKLF